MIQDLECPTPTPTPNNGLSYPLPFRPWPDHKEEKYSAAHNLV